jgi:predicted nucleic acid-binding protein
MARLIVLDASVVIAALAADDTHHNASVAALESAGDDELVLAATTRAEILVGPCRAGRERFQLARDFVDGCATVPISVPTADAAAALKAEHRGLSLPDALALVVADALDADAIWTFDRRWAGVHPRVEFPAPATRD